MSKAGANKNDREMHQLAKKEASTSDHSICSLLSNASTSSNENVQTQKHAETSLRIMENYLKNEQLIDVVLIAGEKRIPAHRLVLSAGSEYFAAMFRNSLKESTQSEVAIQGVDGEALLSLVRYCYTGCIAIRENNVESILSAACLLQLAPVIEACCEFLIKQLDPSNCLGIRIFADAQGCSNLFKAAHNYTSDHFMEVIQNQEFLSLTVHEVEKLLESDDLNIPSEEIIFHALISWLNHDPVNRKKEASKLLALVKLPLLSPAFISDNIENNEWFKDQQSARDLVIEALKYHLLPERRSMLQSSRTRPRKATVGKVFLVGGMDANKGATTIDVFSLRDNAWNYVADMNIARRLQFGAAIIDKKLIVAGGRDGLKTLTSVEYFDFATKHWNPLPPMNMPRHGLGVAVLGGPLYAVGGHDGWSFLNTVERWDPTSRQWSNVSSMCTQRSTVGVAVLNNKLYAVGGRDISSCLNTVECYDPHTDKWTFCAPMSKRRGGVGVGVLNGYLYALGGHDAPVSNPNASRFNCVERYDPTTDTWKMVAPMSVARDSVGVCILGDRLLAVGGYDGQQYLSLVEIYDPHFDKWEQVASLSTGRAGPCVAVKWM